MNILTRDILYCRHQYFKASINLIRGVSNLLVQDASNYLISMAISILGILGLWVFWLWVFWKLGILGRWVFWDGTRYITLGIMF